MGKPNLLSSKLFTIPSILEGISAFPRAAQTQNQSSETSSGDKDEYSALKAGLRKVKIFKEYVSIKRGKKASGKDDNEISESRSDEGDYSNSNSNLVDSESGDDSGDGESFENATFGNHLAMACWHMQITPVDLFSRTIFITSITQIPKRSILPCKKRKLNFKSPPKGEPLLKKDYDEEGGDDIDFDRRQLSSDESLVNLPQIILPASEFGDDSFAIGNWEHREIIFGFDVLTEYFLGLAFCIQFYEVKDRMCHKYRSKNQVYPSLVVFFGRKTELDMEYIVI
ncbi:unnamed protein product [Lactuca virosa]|uniref:Uncharacterized protein n=1 Tax=Lactuca virosa TaxID=75947 RepID=A0AAU9NB58_9ASTR|nr:unnamed protein product [Lactuca virosa]